MQFERCGHLPDVAIAADRQNRSRLPILPVPLRHDLVFRRYSPQLDQPDAVPPCQGGDFFASPVMVGDRIYASNVAGKTFVFVATPKAFQLLASNQLGDEAYASPVICDSRIYLRVAKQGAERQEILYCIGTK